MSLLEKMRRRNDKGNGKKHGQSRNNKKDTSAWEGV